MKSRGQAGKPRTRLKLWRRKGNGRGEAGGQEMLEETTKKKI